MTVLCTVEGCDRPLRARGYCATHWARWRKHGTHVLPARQQYTACTVDGCTRKPRSLGSPLCETHYYRQRRTGTVAEPKRVYGTTCVIDGCDAAATCSGKGSRGADEGYCRLHYLRIKRRGDPHYEHKGANVPKWTGADATNRAVHQRVRALRGSARGWCCADCSNPAFHWSYDHTDPNEKVDPEKGPYSVHLDHYVPRCVPCHKRFDLAYLGRTLL